MDSEPRHETATGVSATGVVPQRQRSSTPDGSVGAKPSVPGSSRTEAVHRIDRISHPIFIFSYLANLSLVTANAATFIFADWVAWISSNGDSQVAYQEELPGRVIQVGLIAAISARLFLGQAIDRFGVRRVWVVMSLLNVCGCAVFAALHTVGPMLYVGRILFATGLAGMFTCATFHIQSCVAELRRTEFLALLGSSGFVGMMLGPQLADLLRWLAAGQDSRFFATVFGTVFCLNCCYIGFLLLATQGHARPTKQARPSLLTLMRRYWPGLVMAVSMVMGLVYTVPSLYLVRFNRHAGIGGIATFWSVYAVAAFVFRVRTAGLSRRVGRYRLIFFGLLLQGLGLWALIPVTEAWHLAFSAMLCGLGHALLFPSIVSLGAGTFPPEFRGSGTNLTLGFLDLGSAISAPLMGRIIDLPAFEGVGFRPMFFVAGSLTLSVALTWLIVNRGRADVENTHARDVA